MNFDDIMKQWNKLTADQRKQVYDIFKDSERGSETYVNLKKLVYKAEPPTPQQYLDWQNGWITKDFADSVYDHVKEDFINIVNGRYDHVALYGGIRLGKSFMARLLIHYTIVYFHHLISPNLFFGVSPASSLTIFITSFKFDKIYQVYLEPLYKMFRESPRMKQVRQRLLVQEMQEKLGVNTLVWSEAAMADHAHITLASGLNLASGNDEQINIIGNDAFQVYISEIAYFIENAGASEDRIFEFYTKASDRIKMTVGKEKPLSFVLLDSSAKNADSKIENHMRTELSKLPECYYRERSLWHARPHLFPKWEETGETFKVCTGDGNYPAQIIDDPKMLETLPVDLVVDVPIDIEFEMKTNLIQNIRDFIGRPTSNDAKFIQQRGLISTIFDDNIPNIEGVITADSKDNPNHLIWDQVKDKLFVKYDGKNMMPKRAPREPRFIGIDLAFSANADIVGFCMGHSELRASNNEVVDVLDLAFGIGPGKHGINLEAVQNFILDLAILGNCRIQMVYLDKFQSENIVQFLGRHGIQAKKHSVDTSLQPYMHLYAKILQNNVKVGNNVFLRNNLDSLYRVKDGGTEKIDHSKGTQQNIYLGDYKNSKCGVHAKDVSDAVAQVLFAIKHADQLPSTIYEKQQERLLPTKVEFSFENSNFQAKIEEARKSFSKAGF